MYIFYYTSGMFGEVVGLFLTGKHSPDAGVGSTGRYPCASGEVSDSACVSRVQWTLALDVGRTLFTRPVMRDVSKCT